MEFRARNSPMVTMTSTSGDALSTGRMTTRSINAPPMKEMTTDRRIATITGTERSVKYQNKYVEYSAISPCAKLRMPVTRKISTSASASDAYTAPFPTPFITCVRKVDTYSSAPQVRAAHGVVAEQLVGGSGRDDRARLEYVAALRDAEREVGVLLDDQHRHTLVGVDRAQRAEELLRDDGCEPERRLVEQHELRPRHQRTCDREHLL